MDYLYYLQNLREGNLSWLTPVLFAVSDFGVLAAVFLSFLIYWIFDKQGGKRIIAGLSLSTCVINIIKNVACINRPWIRDARLHVDPLAAKSATGYSFPSGHSTTASSCYGGIALLKLKNKVLFILLWIFVLAVMFSRNWLGCHTLIDVFTGFAFGVSFMVLAYFLFDKVESSLASEIIFLIAGLLFCAGICVFFMLKSYPQSIMIDGKSAVDISEMKAEGIKNAANFAGFITGWFLERRFINFEIPQEKSKKIIIALLGLVSTCLLYMVICPLVFKVMNIYVRGFLKHFILFFWGMFAFPAIVNCFSKNKN